MFHCGTPTAGFQLVGLQLLGFHHVTLQLLTLHIVGYVQPPPNQQICESI